MRVSTSKSKNEESFYITKSYINDKGKSTSKIIRKLGNRLSMRADISSSSLSAIA